MARKRFRSYFEPWAASRDAAWDWAYKFGPPSHGDTPEEVAQNIADWEAKKAKAEAQADWVLWGSRMSEPSETISLLGKKGFHDGKGIIAVRRFVEPPEGSPSHVDICKRIAECVNAMAGVADPVKFVNDVRSLLWEYAKGECVEDPRDDVRVLSILSRLIPPEQQEPSPFDDHD